MIELRCGKWVSLEAGTTCQLPADHAGECSCRMTIDMGHFGKHTFNYRDSDGAHLASEGE